MDCRRPDGPRHTRRDRAVRPRIASGSDRQPADLRIPVRAGRGGGALFCHWKMRTHTNNRRSKVNLDWSALIPSRDSPELCACLAPLNLPKAPSPRRSPPPRGRGWPAGRERGGPGTARTPFLARVGTMNPGVAASRQSAEIRGNNSQRRSAETPPRGGQGEGERKVALAKPLTARKPD